MLKIKQLQQQQKQKAEAAANVSATTSSDSSMDTSNGKEEGKSSGSSVFTLQKGGKQQADSKRANAAELRAQKDIGEMFIPTGCKVEFKNPDDIMNFTLQVIPTDGMYAGAAFQFSIHIPHSYPYDPPKVHCDTLVYHPNIDLEGHVCLNILRQDWMPVLSLGSVIFGLMTLFLEPNPDDPLNKEAAQLMIDNKKAFQQNVYSSLHGGYVSGKQFPRLL
eukprot:TRINITY_DN2310_c0_g1_i1.p1 TRINITY_DN2310_c0_g1~~TRINITY_DN2310_c0_g1_i1.p1  ORF type:complete len:219 (-),score=66.32 TRINITY_DN2310_c0_g1_i1:203-859(-)